MPEISWTVSASSVSIGGVIESLWQSSTALHKAKHDFIFFQKTKNRTDIKRLKSYSMLGKTQPVERILSVNSAKMAQLVWQYLSRLQPQRCWWMLEGSINLSAPPNTLALLAVYTEDQLCYTPYAPLSSSMNALPSSSRYLVRLPKLYI